MSDSKKSEPLSFERLKVTKRILGKFVPTGIEREIGKETPIVYGAVGSSGVIGISVYSLPETAPVAVRMHYLSIKEEMQNQGIGKKLVDFGCEKIKQAGGRYLLYRNVSVHPDRLIKYLGIGIKLDFLPITESQTLYTYDLEKLRENKILRVADIKKTDMVALTDYASPFFKHFNSKGEFGLLMLDENTFDKKCSYFYLKEGAIAAGVIGKICDGRTLVLREIVSDKFSGERKKILPILLIKSLNAGIQMKGVDKICITLSETFGQQSIEKLFGEPETVYRSIDLVRYL